MESVQTLNFAGYYLADSFLLGVREWEGSLIFEMEWALTETHVAWQPPSPSEQRCYRRGHLIFPEVDSITWHDIRVMPTVDPDGTADLGDLHSVEETRDGNRFRYRVKSTIGTLAFSAAVAVAELS